MLWGFVVLLYITSVWSYQTNTLTANDGVNGLDVSDTCTVITGENKTTVRFHGNRPDLITNRSATVRAVNKDCSLILFGYPEHNKVVMWYPNSNLEINVLPNFNVPVTRFGHALDIQNHTWVVGAPGQPQDHLGQGATAGYAFVYEGYELHSCRSLYDTYCFPVESTCVLGFKNMKDYYNLTDALVPPFQKECRTSGTPNYVTGPLLKDIQPYQQFGFDVVLTGTLHEAAAGLFVSAPGDTNRFMEDNNGQNYGRVFGWKTVLWEPQNDLLDKITWWEMSTASPLQAPELPGATYRAFGRSIAATADNLAVSSYPLYDESSEPFVFIYDCELQDCEEIGDRGISINDLPGNVLGYLTPAELSYTDGKTGSYIPADVEGDQLGDFQNAFIGQRIGIVGSNIILPDPRHGKVYRFGTDAGQRETHTFHDQIGFGTDSQHWIHNNPDHRKLTHMWNCLPGHVGDANVCQPCPTSYYSADGWQNDCDICPRNYTTNETGQSKCAPRKASLPLKFEWEEAVVIIAAILCGSVALYGLFVACECCRHKSRIKRQFVDTVV